ncbi:MAG: FkbM family methyltransferase [Candidatus Binataceae bacterium]
MATAIRHAPGLERADWLWQRLRPIYDRMLRASFAGHGLERVINGTDRIVLSPFSRHFVGESYEPEVWSRLMREVHPDDTVAEVGASIGIYTLALARRVGAHGRVIAFEPDPESAAELEANVAINGWQQRITVTRVVMGASCGEISFACGQGMESHVLNASETSAGTIRVPMTTLDTVFADARVSLLKIDVEGFEEPVLRGAQRLLTDPERRPRVIVVEVHPFAWQAVGTTSESILALLTGARYRVESVEGSPVSRIDTYGHIIAVAD